MMVSLPCLFLPNSVAPRLPITMLSFQNLIFPRVPNYLSCCSNGAMRVWNVDALVVLMQHSIFLLCPNQKAVCVSTLSCGNTTISHAVLSLTARLLLVLQQAHFSWCAHVDSFNSCLVMGAMRCTRCDPDCTVIIAALHANNFTMVSVNDHACGCHMTAPILS